MLITSSEYMRGRLVAALNLRMSSCTESPVVPHLFILFAATKDWDNYIEEFKLKLKIFVSKYPRRNFHIYYPAEIGAAVARKGILVSS